MRTGRLRRHIRAGIIGIGRNFYRVICARVAADAHERRRSFVRVVVHRYVDGGRMLCVEKVMLVGSGGGDAMRNASGADVAVCRRRR